MSNKIIDYHLPEQDDRPIDFDERKKANTAKLHEIDSQIESLKEEAIFLKRDNRTIQKLQNEGFYQNYREWQIAMWIEKQQAVIDQRRRKLDAETRIQNNLLIKLESNYSRWWEKRFSRLFDKKPIQDELNNMKPIEIQNIKIYPGTSIRAVISELKREDTMRFLLGLSDKMCWDIKM